MNNSIIYYADKRILGIIIAIQLISCYGISLVLKKDIFIWAIVFDILIILSIYVFLKNTLIVILTLASSFTLGFMVYNLNAPKYFLYIQDIFIGMMVIKLLAKLIKMKFEINTIYILIMLFTVSSICSYILCTESLLSYIQSLYFDYIRYFIVALFMMNIDYSPKEIIKIAKSLWIVLLLQVPIIIFQYFWGLQHWVSNSEEEIMQDYLCGILGERSTTELGLFIVIALSMMFILYLKNKVSFIYLCISTLIFIGVAIVSEVKFIVFLLPCMFLLILLINFNWKSLCVFLVTIFFTSIAINQLVVIHPEFKGFFSLTSIEKYSNDPYGDSGIGRTESFILANDILTDTNENMLVGYGAGQGDKVSSYKFSAFNISQYLIECGYLGACCIYGIFIYVFFISIKLILNPKSEFLNLLGYYGMFLAIVIIISTFNNRSMVKINFGIISWISIGVIYRYYNLCNSGLYIEEENK